LIGRNIDLDPLSLFPQDWARIMKGERRESKALRFNNGGEREKEATAQAGRRGPFIGPPRKLAIAGHLPRSLRPWGWSLRPQISGHESQSLRTHYRGVHHSWNREGRSLRTLGPESPARQRYTEVPGQNSGQKWWNHILGRSLRP
jgi:hypothetical protein